jgi:putative oxidoreductase
MSETIDVALLILRMVVGGLFIGHGAQKLFGWFGGGGLEETAGSMAALGLHPATVWTLLAGMSELGGGLLTLLGLLNPLGPVALIASMAMAIATVHWGKPIWASQGGAELPLTNMAVAVALILAGPGQYSLDAALQRSLPEWTALPALAIVLAVIAVGLVSRSAPRAAVAVAAR